MFTNGMDYLILGLLLAIGLIYLCMGFFRRVARGETEVGVHTILLVLVVAILLVPFVMNVSAHLLAQLRHPHSEGGAVNAEAHRD
ncbi:hypothetical protein [Nitrosovibrio sp. Nv17]|uniref:hypothetical protein n=1 Tax=Nitrosovibrio sp. Nv17 TaxID=1855339 RepID=UPI000908BDFC|nr:hypothetical protein [Nitrosovibrio sp. Nv17]SFW30441.1 hypothetical protein SAMN05216414_1146 [Nitrosovibrio sp. Nv17]